MLSQLLKRLAGSALIFTGLLWITIHVTMIATRKYSLENTVDTPVNVLAQAK
jgi:hypothetical protein